MSELKPCPVTQIQAYRAYEKLLEIMEDETDDQTEVFSTAYKALYWIANGRRAQPANEPLTIEQLLEMEQRGEGIYVTHADGSPIFRGKQYTAAVLDRIAASVAMGYHLQAIYGRGLTLAEDDCGKTWLAYRRQPEGSENDVL
jgi:hypothetical protein